MVRLRNRAHSRGVIGVIIVAALVLGGGVAWILVGQGGNASTGASGGSPGSRARFVSLASAHTNYCSLDRGTVEGYPDDQHIQGACCDPMDQEKYQHQVEALRQYANIPEIPKDPYDIVAGQAKQLLRYDDTIKLAADDQATFDAAMQMTDDHGPCCCQCWRWYMTEGLDKFLITSHHMSAQQVAEITDLVNGCGGPLGSTPSPTNMAPSR